VTPLLLLAGLLQAGPGMSAATARPPAEAQVALDARDAPILDVVRVLAEAGGFQTVFDPGIDCRLTLKLHASPWRRILETTLAACQLGVEEQGDVLRIAPVARLRAEAEARRKLAQEQASRPSGRLALVRLSYARAEQVAPLLQKLLPPRASIGFDARTNTLILRY
jgi:type IV pilus assembly protein PilQ